MKKSDKATTLKRFRAIADETNTYMSLAETEVVKRIPSSGDQLNAFVLDLKNEGMLTELTETSHAFCQDYWDRYNQTDEPIRKTTLHQLFIEQCRRMPQNTAVLLGSESLTYQELNLKSNQIACYLKSIGVAPGDLVGVLAKRCPATIVNVLGILKAGAAYVPIKQDYPPERVKYILENSCSQLLLDPVIYHKNHLQEYPDSEVNEGLPEDLAYVIYTSGSTGTPKGVMIKHESAANTVIDINQKFHMTEKDRIIGLASLCFDLSVYDIFGALSTGATLVMVPDQRDTENLLRLLEAKNITFWNSVPAVMEMLVNYLDTIDFSKSKTITSLKSVLLSGDWIPVTLPGRIKQYFPRAEVISLGGATEVSIWSIYYSIQEVDSCWTSIPYGRPLANQKFYVLDENRELCPVGVPGELYIGGVGVAMGYLNDSEKTENAFIGHSSLGMVYKTGDFGVLRYDGTIEFLGRKDTQVKIKGYRIELGEIESRLLKNPSVKQAVVSARTDQSGKKYLAAYVLLNSEISCEALRQHLSEALPNYMIPSRFVFLEHIPLTANGKIDRNQLPEPDPMCNS